MITQYQPPGIAQEGRPYQLAYAEPNAGMYAILGDRGMARGFCKGTQSCCRLRASVGFGSPLVVISNYCSPCRGGAQSWPWYYTWDLLVIIVFQFELSINCLMSLNCMEAISL